MPGRMALDVVFALLLASGAGAGLVCLLVLRNLVDPQGEGAFGIYIYGLLSFIPTVLAWVGSGVFTILGSAVREVWLAAAITTGHLVWWSVVVALLLTVASGPSAMVKVALAEPGLYAAAAALLGVRWFRSARALVPR